ncbi:MAG: OadG family protein [Lachnospiraceae bacterium]|nr:OadG family protein [Lachnospiraceae bacterium]MDE6184584.1 OadG family protein [Lachnospiraceae bacterium]
MKKWLLVLGMITCMLGLSACSQKEEAAPFMTEAAAEEYVQDNIIKINRYVQTNTKDQVTDLVWLNAIESWEQAAPDMGDYEKIVSIKYNLEEKDGVVNARIKGSKREASVEFVFEDGVIANVTTNVEYSFGEKMEKAALNTLLGMGTVFTVLILISLIIGCFGFIPKIQAKFDKKSKKEEVKKTAVDNTIAQIIEKEELSDDYELVAVIAAAIAASEGASSTDGFVVRSIRRAGNKRQRA